MRIRQRRGSVSVFGSMHTNGLLSLVAVLSNVRGRKVDSISHKGKVLACQHITRAVSRTENYAH